MQLTKREQDALGSTLHMERVLDAAMSTGRTLRLSTMRKLEAKGFVVEKLCIMVDDDVFHRDPERWRRCFALTDAGRAAAVELEREESEMFKRTLEVTP